MNKRPNFWSVYHDSRKYDDLQVFNFIGCVVRSQKKPFRKKSRRGRNLKFDPHEYA